MTKQIPEFPSNRQTKPTEIEPISGGVRMRNSKAGTIRRVGNSLFEEIVLPGIKEMVFSFFQTGARRLIFGEYDQESHGVRRGGFGGRAVTQYNRAYGGARNAGRTYYRQPAPPERAPDLNDYQDVIFDNLDDAHHVLGQLQACIADYGIATLGDFYARAGIGSTNYTHQRYGWTDLTGVRVETYHDGHVIAFPDIQFFNN